MHEEPEAAASPKRGGAKRGGANGGVEAGRGGANGAGPGGHGAEDSSNGRFKGRRNGRS